MKRKMIYTFIAIAALSVAFNSCRSNDSDRSVSAVSINAPAATTLNVYGTGNPNTLQLTATVSPTDANNLSLIWESSNNNIAVVTQAGVVTAQNAGSVVIFAFSSENHNIYDSVVLTITRGPHPTWGEISFLTNNEWTFSEGPVTQIWSDVVKVENAFDTPEAFHATQVGIIRNEDGFGDLFSWNAVNQLRSSLCPYPWRVPSNQDFVALDILLGGEGVGRNPSTQELIDAYRNDWGAIFSGSLSSEGTDIGGRGTEQGSGFFWSSTPNDNHALALQVSFGIMNNATWTPAPNQDEPSQAEGGSAAGAGCTPANGFMFGSWNTNTCPDGVTLRWNCFSMVEELVLVTIPGANIGVNSGFSLRCLR
ncbi:MAG: Ig-like domain-containing protein [Bacteroidales bacterium]|nr:Ig-like domain-containing protein [Bacteroidales bacterium]